PPQHGQPAGGVDRVGERVDDLPVRVGRRDLGQVLRHGPPGDREHVAVQQARVEQGPHHHRYATDVVHIGHDVPAERLDVRQVWYPVGDPVEVVEAQRYLCLVCDRQQVEYRVGRPAERHHHRDRVLERLPGEDVAGGDTPAEQPD